MPRNQKKKDGHGENDNPNGYSDVFVEIINAKGRKDKNRQPDHTGREQL
jgi:hypothetical protein